MAVCPTTPTSSVLVFAAFEEVSFTKTQEDRRGRLSYNTNLFGFEFCKLRTRCAQEKQEDRPATAGRPGHIRFTPCRRLSYNTYS